MGEGGEGGEGGDRLLVNGRGRRGVIKLRGGGSKALSICLFQPPNNTALQGSKMFGWKLEQGGGVGG